MFTRRAQLDLFAPYDLPLVNITAECECRDFVAPAKRAGLPPFALLLHGIGRASLEVEEFRWRLEGGEPVRIDALTLSYTMVGADGHLTFSTFEHDADREVFLARYLEDREAARAAAAGDLRLRPLQGRGYLFTTCLPWLRFTQIQHPVAKATDCSIPSVAVGKFEQAGGRVSFPLAVQAHHGLVDGIHVARYMARLSEIMDETAAGLSGDGWC